MTFSSRHDAGQKLAERFLGDAISVDLILGLPRGGVIVASAMAHVLHCPLDVLVVRKIGHPRFREFAVGAMAEPDVVFFDSEVLRRSRVSPDALEKIVDEETDRLIEYRKKFAAPQRATLENRVVAIVDDGLATGATAEAAVESAKKQGACEVVLAIPIASTSGFARLSRTADRVIALFVDPQFEAVGQYYRSFPQTTDEEVIDALRRRA